MFSCVFYEIFTHTFLQNFSKWLLLNFWGQYRNIGQVA